jgi:hypothetical protein
VGSLQPSYLHPWISHAIHACLVKSSFFKQRSGKWNAMHVRIAWLIYHHQQKQKTSGGTGSDGSRDIPSLGARPGDPTNGASHGAKPALPGASGRDSATPKLSHGGSLHPPPVGSGPPIPPGGSLPPGISPSDGPLRPPGPMGLGGHLLGEPRPPMGPMGGFGPHPNPMFNPSESHLRD